MQIIIPNINFTPANTIIKAFDYKELNKKEKSLYLIYTIFLKSKIYPTINHISSINFNFIHPTIQIENVYTYGLYARNIFRKIKKKRKAFENLNMTMIIPITV